MKHNLKPNEKCRALCLSGDKNKSEWREGVYLNMAFDRDANPVFIFQEKNGRVHVLPSINCLSDPEPIDDDTTLFLSDAMHAGHSLPVELAVKMVRVGWRKCG